MSPFECIKEGEINRYLSHLGEGTQRYVVMHALGLCLDNVGEKIKRNACIPLISKFQTTGDDKYIIPGYRS